MTTPQYEWPKIPTLFMRDATGQVIPEVNPICEWVLNTNDGLTTIKIDGVCVKTDLVDGKWTIAKRMSEKHFMLVHPDDHIDKHLWEAFHNQEVKSIGYFEVYGKDVKGNPYGIEKNLMVKISPVDYSLVIARGTTSIRRGVGSSAKDLFDTLKSELYESTEIEGIVWHLENSTGLSLVRSAKVKRVDFGFPWPAKGIAKPEQLLLVN